ncbi:MAG: RNA 3'-terminal phosphate cyclase [Thermoplasmata archaeon]|nr:RNA 3'-terminal phosphate cyclase [Thermoplasmata archaeon]
MIEIDGGYGEGGGQILRMSVAMAALTGKSIRIKNIRANRPTPGLKRQHMVAVEAVAKLCNAEVKGLEMGSTSLEFHPGELKGGEFELDVGTAGSITLVLQACLIPSIFAKGETRLLIRGGTDVKWAPPWDYFQNVILPMLKEMGVEVEAYLNSRGYYPAGGGEVEIFVKPCRMLHTPSFSGDVEGVEGIVNISNLPVEIAERIRNAALEKLKENGMDADIIIEETSSASPGTGIVLWTRGKHLGGDCLGERGKRAEQVGREAAEKIIAEIKSGADLDVHGVDNILPYMAIAGEGKFKCREISKHAETEMWLLKKFMDVEFLIGGGKLKEVEVRRG